MLYDLIAPAKLNLFLHVTGRRSDGYHLLQTVFRFIDLADSIHIDVTQSADIGRLSDMPGVLPDDDLVVKAARALQQATGVKRGAAIAVDKKIPTGGGLGGGSSDAATVLIALNRLWQTGLSREALMQIGLGLGADVPVFIFGQNAFAEGIGEQLAAVDLPSEAYVVIQPSQNVPTLGVFQSPDLTRNTPQVKITDLSDDLAVFGRNDLQPVVLGMYPRMQEALDWLERVGFDARMTGSGACYFKAFKTLEGAQAARQMMDNALRKEVAAVAGGIQQVPIQAIFACRGLTEHPLRHWLES